MSEQNQENVESFDFDGEERHAVDKFDQLLPKAVELATQFSYNPRVRDDEWLGKSLHIDIPNGRSCRTVIMDEPSELEIFLSAELGSVGFVDGLDAVCDFKNGTVEVGIVPSVGTVRNISRIFYGDTTEDNPTPIQFVSADEKHSFSIAPTSDLYRLLCFRVYRTGCL